MSEAHLHAAVIRSSNSNELALDKTQGQPSEVIAEILWHVYDGRAVLPPIKDGCTWTLGHVCSRWRQILWNSPSLWTDITVGLEISHYQAGYGFEVWEKNICETLNHILPNTNNTLSLTVLSGNIRYVSDIILSPAGRFWKLVLSDVSQQFIVVVDTSRMIVYELGGVPFNIFLRRRRPIGRSRVHLL